MSEELLLLIIILGVLIGHALTVYKCLALIIVKLGEVK
jgi:hypothetical protein